MSKLQNKNLVAVQMVLAHLKQFHIITLRGRGVIDRMFELAKFPETHISVVDPWYKNRIRNNKGTAYKNQQYDVLRYFLINNGFLKQEVVGKRIHYHVTDKVKTFTPEQLINLNAK